MNKEKYLAEKSRLTDGMLPDTESFSKDTLNRTFNFVSANLLNFLPDLKPDMHESVFNQMLMHQQLSMLEYQYPGVIHEVTTEGSAEEAMELMKKQPCIICTFHMGSNRLLNHYLAYHQIPYAVVMANHIASGEGNDFSDLFADLYQQQSGEGFTLIEAQRPDAGLKMLRELKKGRSLLIYIDGNTGAGDDSFRNENRSCIDFLNGQIYARSGVGYMSHLANVPVLPVVCYRKNMDDLRLRFGQPVYPDQLQPRKAYAAAATQTIYNFFTPLLGLYPEQWECWMYLHKTVDCNSLVMADSAPHGQPAIEGLYQLNKSRFGFFNIGEELYLFNKRSYTSYRVNNDIYQVLSRSFTLPVRPEELNSQVFEQLYANRVFIEA